VAGSKMKSTNGWKLVGNGPHVLKASNSSKFSGLPGSRRFEDGIFDHPGLYGDWWSSFENEADTRNAWLRSMSCTSGILIKDDLKKGNGFSVRCLRD